MRKRWSFLIIGLVTTSFAMDDSIVLPTCCDYANRSEDFTTNFFYCNETVNSSIFKSEWKGHNVLWEQGVQISCGSENIPFSHLCVPEYLFDINGDGSLSIPCGGELCCGNPLPEIYSVSNWTDNNAFCMDYSDGMINAIICPRPEKQYPPSSLLKISCMIISALMLVITCVINLTEESVKKESYVPYLVAQSISLTIAFLCLAWIQSSIKISSTFHCWHCLLVGYCLQYFFLAAFFWMNAKCINVYMNMRQLTVPRTNKVMVARLRRQNFRRFSVYAWGVPLFITVATYSLQMSGIVTDPRMRPDVGSRSLTCFFQIVTVKWLYFYGPLSAIIMTNLILFVLTATVLVKQRANIFSNVGRRKKDKSRLQKEIWFFNQYMKLFIVNGLSWIFEVLEFGFDYEQGSWQHIFWQVMDILNCLQGVFIFYFFVCQKEIIVKKLFCCSRKTKVKTSKGLSQTCPDERTTFNTAQLEFSVDAEQPKCAATSIPLKTVSMVFNQRAESLEFVSADEDDENETETVSFMLWTPEQFYGVERNDDSER